MAKKIYLVKKNPQGPQTEDNWKQLTGKEFHKLRKSPEGKGRYFIRMGDDFNDGSDIIFIEATKEQYFEWAKEHDRHVYLQNQNRDYMTLSLDVPGADASDVIVELIKASVTDPEQITVSSEAGRELMKMLADLYPSERNLIRTLVDDEYTLNELCDSTGFSYKTLLKRRERLTRQLYRRLQEKCGLEDGGIPDEGQD